MTCRAAIQATVSIICLHHLVLVFCVVMNILFVCQIMIPSTLKNLLLFDHCTCQLYRNIALCSWRREACWNNSSSTRSNHISVFRSEVDILRCQAISLRHGWLPTVGPESWRGRQALLRPGRWRQPSYNRHWGRTGVSGDGDQAESDWGWAGVRTRTVVDGWQSTRRTLGLGRARLSSR